jgi:hypothetical protein
MKGIVVALAAVALLIPAAGAQTPAPDAPPPDLCRVEARGRDDLNATVATPAARPATPEATVVPAGTPADPETVAGVTATVRELVACFNAGELFRAYGLYTDDYLRDLFWRQPPLSQADYDALATPQPAPAGKRVEILAIEDVRLLADGRAGANVTLRYAVIPMPKHFFMTFVWTGERWLIDDILGEITFSVP